VFGRACGRSFAQPEIAINLFEAKLPTRILTAAGAFAVFLNRRTRYGAVRAEHAAIARQRFELPAATVTDIEELAGVRRHLLNGLMVALRASQR
jgi:hypothetical protein